MQAPGYLDLDCWQGAPGFDMTTISKIYINGTYIAES